MGDRVLEARRQLLGAMRRVELSHQMLEAALDSEVTCRKEYAAVLTDFDNANAVKSQEEKQK